MFKTSRDNWNRVGRVAAAGASVSILLATTTLMAATGSQAATAHAAHSQCQIVVKAAPWHFRRYGSGDKYKLTAEGMSCSSARGWVVTFTHEKNKGLGMLLRNPSSGYICESVSTAASGDKNVYAGVCRHPPDNIPFFGWTPRVK